MLKYSLIMCHKKSQYCYAVCSLLPASITEYFCWSVPLLKCKICGTFWYSCIFNLNYNLENKTKNMQADADWYNRGHPRGLSKSYTCYYFQRTEATKPTIVRWDVLKVTVYPHKCLLDNKDEPKHKDILKRDAIRRKISKSSLLQLS